MIAANLERPVMIKSLSTVALAFALVAGNAFAGAAPIATVAGSALVNQGAGFVPATDKTVLKTGDRVMGLKGSKARLVYANGCQINLSGSAATVSGAAQRCASKDLDKTVEAGGADAGLILPIVVGAGLVAGIAVAVSHNNTTTSP